jgi:hypothetical protein
VGCPSSAGTAALGSTDCTRRAAAGTRSGACVLARYTRCGVPQAV